MGIAYGDGERVNTGFVTEPDGVGRVRAQNLVRFPLALVTADHAELRFDCGVVVACEMDNIFDDFYIFFKRKL